MELVQKDCEGEDFSAPKSLDTFLPIEVFDGLRAGVRADRSQFFKDLSMPFYGYNRPGAKVSEGLRESFWLQSMLAGYPGCYDCINSSLKPTSPKI
jgi:hypothetical protein